MKPLRALLSVAYPFLVFGAPMGLESPGSAMGLAGVVRLRAITLWRSAPVRHARRLLAPTSAVAALLLGTLLLNEPRFLLVVPTLTGAALLFACARRLFGGAALVEPISRRLLPHDLAR